MKEVNLVVGILALIASCALVFAASCAPAIGQSFVAIVGAIGVVASAFLIISSIK